MGQVVTITGAKDGVKVGFSRSPHCTHVQL